MSKKTENRRNLQMVVLAAMWMLAISVSLSSALALPSQPALWALLVGTLLFYATAVLEKFWGGSNAADMGFIFAGAATFLLLSRALK